MANPGPSGVFLSPAPGHVRVQRPRSAPLAPFQTLCLDSEGTPVLINRFLAACPRNLLESKLLDRSTASRVVGSSTARRALPCAHRQIGSLHRPFQA